jgi:hypothetical protein
LTQFAAIAVRPSIVQAGSIAGPESIVTEADYYGIINEFLDLIQRSRPKLSDSDKTTVLEVLKGLGTDVLKAAVRQMALSGGDELIDEIVQLALRPKDELPRVPNALVSAIINHTKERYLCGTMYPLILVVRLGFKDLPRGLRVIYTLSVLEGEVYNGGFVQFIDNAKNSKEEYTEVAVEDCRLVEATQKAGLLEEAIVRFREWDNSLEMARREGDATGRLAEIEMEVDARFWPQFEKLDEAYYALESAEPIFDLAEKYIRAHPEQCLEH